MNKRSVVMIVDDDDSVRRAARRLIRSFGFAVDTFPSAENFLASGRLDETACLVLDVHMPGLSGLELQARLNAMGTTFPSSSSPPSPTTTHGRTHLRLARMPTSSNPSRRMTCWTASTVH